jgi:hypothetical protein
VTGPIVTNDAALGEDRVTSALNVRRTIRQQWLRGIGLDTRRPDPEWRSFPWSVPPATSGPRQWLGRAWGALAGGDYQQAVYAAGKARRYGETAQASLLLARAEAGLERFEDAVVEAQRAVRLAPDEPEHYLTLACIFHDLGNWEAALGCYRTAGRLAPDSDAPSLGKAMVLVQTGDLAGAQLLLEAVYARSPDNRTAGDCLSLVLIEAAEQIPEVREGETYFVTSRREVAEMRARLDRAAEVTRDPDLLACVAKIRAYVDTCARREWLTQRMFQSRTGRICLALLAILGGGVAAAPVLSESPIPFLVAMTLPVGRIAHRLLLYAWVPRWRLNRSAHEREIERTAPPPTAARTDVKATGRNRVAGRGTLPHGGAWG